MAEIQCIGKLKVIYIVILSVLVELQTYSR